MNRLSVLALCLLLSAQQALAERVIRTVPDTTAGKAFGGLSGLMLGAAAGGPIGGLIGAGSGLWLGAAVQRGVGLTQSAYEIEDEGGRRRLVRSPNTHFRAGQKVARQGLRLIPASVQEKTHTEH